MHKITASFSPLALATLKPQAGIAAAPVGAQQPVSGYIYIIFFPFVLYFTFS